MAATASKTMGDPAASGNNEAPQQTGLQQTGPQQCRVDQWLWAVRQTKTRSAATAAARAGHVRINNEVAKAASPVRVGDTVRYRVRGFDRILIVRGIITKRVSAKVAAQMLENLTPALPDTWMPAPFQRERGSGRPTKKERRQLDALRGRTELR